VNANFLNGFHYGSFNNSEEMHLNLDFTSIKVDGVQFNFVAWMALDDPTITGITGSNIGGLSFLGVPGGKTNVTYDGKSQSVSYLEFLYRKNSFGVREKETKFFGKLGTPISADKSYVDWLTEGTTLLAGANCFFAGATETYAAI
jgi:hypothetical protein